MTGGVRLRVRLQELLDEARDFPEADLAERAVRVGELLLAESLALETSEERAHKARLDRLLAEPHFALFGSVLTDRGFRSSAPERTVEIARALARRLELSSRATGLDGILLSALVRFGRYLPDLAREGILGRIASESRAYVQTAELDGLSAFLAARTAEGFQINLNYLGEEVLGEREAEKHALAYVPFLERADLFALSVKLSGLTSRVNAIAPEATVRHVYPRLVELAERNLARSSPPKLLYFDMEAYRDVEATLSAFARLALDFPALPLGVALQAYLPESSANLRRVMRIAERRKLDGGAPIYARLVKGANLGMERVSASRSGLETPIFPDKAAVDAQYKRLLRIAQAAPLETLRIGLASHNLFDIALGLLEGRRHPSPPLHFEMLAGMGGALARVLLEVGAPVMLYTPAVLPEHFSSAIAYLLRRLDESTAADNFLRRAPSMTPGDRSFEEEAAKFRAALAASSEPTIETRRTQNRAKDRDGPLRSEAFANVPDTDFTRPANREALQVVLESVHEEVPLARSLVADEPVSGPERFGFDPSRPNHVAYRFTVCSATDVERALVIARRAADHLRSTDVASRVELLERVANELEHSRFRLIATMVKDTAKRVLEADLEVSEAVDFARYYAREFRTLAEAYETSPLGVVSITPPWNFPLAIPLGGILAAFVAGNAVLFKPAPEAILVGHELHACLLRAGIDPTFIQLLIVDDEEASPLVADARVDAVILTGATETALRFLKMRPKLRLLAETGGKNCAYVSAEADRESAISAIVQSAFGHAGQKCSALSVLVLEREVYESRAFREALVDAASSLLVGSAWAPETFVTPLIHPPRGPLTYAISKLERGERFLLAPQVDEENPRLVSPAIRLGVRVNSPSHTQEFFGPHLALVRALDLDHALSIMNVTRYGLTAGLFSLNEAEREAFLTRMNAGNLYVNRALTGAVVGRQPFGGRKASSFGPGGKAGGPHYLPQVCRLTERRRATSPGLEATSSRASFEAECRRSLSTDFFGARLTRVVGEKNELRYERAATAILALEGTNEEVLRECLVAYRIAASGAREAFAKLPVLRSGESRFPFESEFADLADFLDLTALPELNAERVRVLGRGDPPILDRLRSSGVYVEHRSSRGSARAELSFFLREKSISVEAHRYGNLRLADVEREFVRPSGEPS